MTKLQRRYPPAVDAFRACKLIAFGRESARQISEAQKANLPLSSLGSFRGLWLIVLAFAIAVRLLKTTYDVRAGLRRSTGRA